MKIKVNFDEPKSFTPLPDGAYNISIEKVEQRMSQTSGNPTLNITARVMDGKYKNRTIFYNLSLQETAKWKLQQFVRELGLDAEKGSHTFDTNEWVGKKLIFIVRQNTATERTDVIGIKAFEDKDVKNLIEGESDEKGAEESNSGDETLKDILG